VLALLALSFMLASCEDTEEDTSQAATEGPTAEATKPQEQTPGPGATLWRWGNVTVIVPDDSGIAVSRYIAPPQRLPPNGGPEIDLIRGDSQVGINGTTGAVTYKQVQAEDIADFDGAIATIRVAETNSSSLLAWPFGSEQPTDLKRQQGNLLYWEPDPASGVVSYYSCGAGPNAGGCVIGIENSRSRRAIDVDTGEVVVDSVAPEDAEAFDRWTQTVETAGS
jgi:hypothetical protein